MKKKLFIFTNESLFLQDEKIFCDNIDIKSSPSENHYDCLLEIKGSIDLKEQFNAIEAYNNISEKCHDLHKGSDGISKTWTHVDVHVKAFIDKKPFK